MSAYFLDSSALVKLYLEEQGTKVVKALIESNAHVLLISGISRLEVVAAVTRRGRGLPDVARQLASGLEEFLQDID